MCALRAYRCGHPVRSPEGAPYARPAWDAATSEYMRLMSPIERDVARKLHARLSTSGLKGHALLRDAPSGQGAEEPVRGIVATDSGKIYSVGYDRQLRIWDTDHLAQTSGGAKKKKAAPVAKSLIIWEVKPWGEDTDLEALAAKIIAI